VEVRGEVVLATLGRGSKSQRRAVCLEADGRRFVLRQKGGNAFEDPALVALVGSTIRATGDVVGTTLLLTGWVVEEAPEPDRPRKRRET
jgi:hypothetical protein